MKLNMDSPVIDFMNTTAQYVALNIVFIISCIPIITIGPAIAAMYQVLLREARGEHGYIIRKYLQHFKEMFVQGVFTFLLFMILLAVGLFSFIFWHGMASTISAVVNVLLIIMLVAVLSAMIYVFPLMARFKNSFGQTIKNAFYISLSNIKYTMAFLLIHVFVFGMIYLFPVVRIFMIFIGFSFVTYCCAYIFTRLFRQYETNETSEVIENDEVIETA
ncbi:MAG: YesL family protein [Coprococcus sp.]